MTMTDRERAQRFVELALKNREGMNAEVIRELKLIQPERAEEWAEKYLEALEVLEDVEWSAADGFEEPFSECPVCGATRRKGKHKDNCKLGALLGKSGKGATINGH